MKLTFLSGRFRQSCRQWLTPTSRRQVSRRGMSDCSRQVQQLEDRALLHAGNEDLDDLSAANGGDGSHGAIIEGIDAGDQAGQSVSAAGDVNGDGKNDFIVSAHLGDHSTVTDDGELYVVFGTSAGWQLILFGNLIGLLFASAVLTLSVISFPLLLDRDVGAGVAILTSIRAVMLNPVQIFAWGLMVAEGKGDLVNAFHLLLFPGGAICLTVLALVLIGDGLRDALDPKLK